MRNKIIKVDSNVGLKLQNLELTVENPERVQFVLGNVVRLVNSTGLELF